MQAKSFSIFFAACAARACQTRVAPLSRTKCAALPPHRNQPPSRFRSRPPVTQARKPATGKPPRDAGKTPVFQRAFPFRSATSPERKNPARKFLKILLAFKSVICYPTHLFSPHQSASLTQLVECHLAKVVVEGSSPLARSIFCVRGDMVKWGRSSAGRASDS